MCFPSILELKINMDKDKDQTETRTTLENHETKNGKYFVI